MIGFVDYLVVTHKARKYAREFINQHNPLHLSSGSPMEREHKFDKALKDFLGKKNIIFEPLVGSTPSADLNGFWSWITTFNTDGKNDYILFNFDQFFQGERDKKLPQKLQKRRCIVHEFAHIVLQHIDRKFPGKVKSTKEDQEESAWVFTETFMGVVWGDYALRTRKAGSPDDVVVAWM